jgi:hypothetical protein
MWSRLDFLYLKMYEKWWKSHKKWVWKVSCVLGLAPIGSLFSWYHSGFNVCCNPIVWSSIFFHFSAFRIVDYLCLYRSRGVTKNVSISWQNLLAKNSRLRL